MQNLSFGGAIAPCPLQVRACYHHSECTEQWCRSKPIARGALLIAIDSSFFELIFIRNFEAKSTYLYKQMILLSSKQHSFTALYLVIWRFLHNFLTLK